MTKEEALQAMRKEPDKIEKIDGGERWSFQCFDSDGYWHTCYVFDFKDDIAVKVRNMD